MTEHKITYDGKDLKDLTDDEVQELLLEIAINVEKTNEILKP
jgi:hypothetical protein